MRPEKSLDDRVGKEYESLGTMEKESLSELVWKDISDLFPA